MMTGCWTRLTGRFRSKKTDRPQSIGELRTALPPLDDWGPPRSSQPPISEPERSEPDTEGSTSRLPRWVSIAGIVALMVAMVTGAYWLGQRTLVVPNERAAVSEPTPPAQQQTESPAPPEAVSAPPVEEEPVVAPTPEAPEPDLAPPDPAAIETALGLEREERIMIQRGLYALEYAPGPADGAFGPSTRQALEQWQTAKGYAANRLSGTGASRRVAGRRSGGCAGGRIRGGD